MSVGRICSREVYLCEADETVEVAAGRMAEKNVGTLVVRDAENRPVGIVTDRDLATRVLGERRDPEITRVEEVMTSCPQSISEETPIEDALVTMRYLRVRRLPIVDRDQRLVGLISVDDVLYLLAEEFRSLGAIVETGVVPATRRAKLEGETPATRDAAITPSS